MTTHVFAVMECEAWEGPDVVDLYGRRYKAEKAAEAHARFLAAERRYPYITQGPDGDWYIGREEGRSSYTVSVVKMKVL